MDIVTNEFERYSVVNAQWPADVSKLLIIGCGGFVGSHILDALLQYQSSVKVVGMDPSDVKIKQHLGKPNFELHRIAYGEKDLVDKFDQYIEWADAVVNLAAICNPADYNTRPLDVIDSNFIKTYFLPKSCARYNTWLIHFSTSEVYGRTISSYIQSNTYSSPDWYELDEDHTPLIMGPIHNQRWTYACAKQLLERYIYALNKECDLPFTIVRPLNFFGPRMDYIPGRDGEGVPRVLASFMAALLDHTPIQLVDGGTARRTIISIRDAVRAVLLILQKRDSAKNQIFNIGNRNNEVTMAELAEMMRKIYAKITGDSCYNEHPVVSVSSDEFYGEGYEDCDRRMPVLDKAKELLGWEPVILLEETLYETMSWYHEHYAGK